MSQPTEKQVDALRAFGVPVDEIANMDFSQASAKLSQLIRDANAKKSKVTLPMKGEGTKPMQPQGKAASIPRTATAPNAKPEVDVGRGRTAPSSIQEPVGLTEKDLNAIWEKARIKATDKIGEDEVLDKAKQLEYVRGYLQIQSQEYNLALTIKKMKYWGNKNE